MEEILKRFIDWVNQNGATDEDAQNITNQVIRRNAAAGILARERVERLDNQQGRSSTVVSINKEILPYYIQSFLQIEGDQEIVKWEERYRRLEQSGQLFRSKYSKGR